MKHPAREECRGCIWCGKGTHCAGLALRWAWHKFLLALYELLKDSTEQPEPCGMREEWPDGGMEND